MVIKNSKLLLMQTLPMFVALRSFITILIQNPSFPMLLAARQSLSLEVCRVYHGRKPPVVESSAHRARLRRKIPIMII